MKKIKVCDLGGDVRYERAFRLQELLSRRLISGRGDGYLLLLEHSPVYTLGRNASDANVLIPRDELLREGIDLVNSTRGGDVTYHGPGQVVGYPILNLGRGSREVVRYVSMLEDMLIDCLGSFGIDARTDPRNRGVWTEDGKIAALGVRVSRGITTHGFALNVAPDMNRFGGIIPCGLSDAAVTSMARYLKETPGIDEVKRRLVRSFCDIFGYAASRVGC